jgi:hypothetical protein
MKRIFNHVTLWRVWELFLNAVVIGMTALAFTGIIGIIIQIIADPSIMDNASFGIYN